MSPNEDHKLIDELLQTKPVEVRGLFIRQYQDLLTQDKERLIQSLQRWYAGKSWDIILSTADAPRLMLEGATSRETASKQLLAYLIAKKQFEIFELLR